MVKFPLLWACKDGSVAFHFWIGPNFIDQNKALAAWVKESGVAPGLLENFDWEHDSFQNYSGEDVMKVRKTIEDFFMCYKKMEIHEGALQRRIQLTPVLAIRDLPEFSQLVARNFFRDIEHPELGTKLKYPGGSVKVGIGDCGTRFRAPLIGEHNDEVYQEELGFSAQERVNMKQRGVI
jgi:crotonobetainyl-CoA:carnitine CoA-transferase CaiB-like acyl-CoA transferase